MAEPSESLLLSSEGTEDRGRVRETEGQGRARGLENQDDAAVPEGHVGAREAEDQGGAGG